MSTQYTLKDDWKPVGSSKAAKKLADWMNAIAKQLNRAEVVSGGTARPSDLGFRIEVDGVGDYPFKLTHSSSAIRVRVGAVQRNGTDATLAPDSGEEYKSITTLSGGGAFGASTTYKVYGILDAALVPTSLTVAAAAALPADTQRNLYFEIGEATTNADSEISGVDNTWTGGDRDDVSYEYDADSPTDAVGAPKNYSMEKSVAGGHVGEGQQYGWIGATSTTPDYDAGDLMEYRDVETDGNGDHYVQKYCTIDDALVNVDWDYNGGSLGSAIGDWLNDNYVFGDYWIRGGDSNNCYGSAIGNASGFPVIDLLNYQLVDSNNYKISVDWKERILYQEDGTTGILKYTAPNAGWYLDFGTPTDDGENIWNVDGLKVGSTTTAIAGAGAIYTPGGIACDDGAYIRGVDFNVDLTGNWNIQNTAGDIMETDGNEFRINGGSASGLRLTSAAFINIAPDGDIKYDGVAGVTLTNWTNSGGLTGTSIIEIDADELRDTDKILVVR